MKHLLLLLTLIFIIASPWLWGDAVEDLLLKGDELYVRRGEPGLAAQALATYQEALALAPGSVSVMAKNLQAMFFIGDNSPAGADKQRIFKAAMELSRKAVALHPDRVEGHYWLGVHTGSYGQARGVLKSLFLKNDIIRAMNKAIAIDGAYENGGAYCVLGRLYFKVPGLFGGSNKKSRRFHETCRQLAPRRSNNLLFLAETYWALDEEELAIKTLEELQTMEPDPLWLPETEKDKQAGARLLQRYKK
jgi:tetratricopeptide (TPR) repeat protein